MQVIILFKFFELKRHCEFSEAILFYLKDYHVVLLLVMTIINFTCFQIHIPFQPYKFLHCTNYTNLVCLLIELVNVRFVVSSFLWRLSFPNNLQLFLSSPVGTKADWLRCPSQLPSQVGRGVSVTIHRASLGRGGDKASALPTHEKSAVNAPPFPSLIGLHSHLILFFSLFIKALHSQQFKH